MADISELDALIRSTFDTLVQDAARLAERMRVSQSYARRGYSQSGPIVAGELEVEESEFERVRTRALSLLALLTAMAPHIDTISRRILKMPCYEASAHELHGVLVALKLDYENGILDRAVRIVEVNVVADYLTLAEQLFADEPGPHRHIPAAVLAGAVLEDGLRRLCQRQTPPVDTRKANGDPKTLNPLIDDLKAVGVFNELKAKQLRAWADIRNAAAHGEFDKFGVQDVEAMLKGVGDFLASFL